MDSSAISTLIAAYNQAGGHDVRIALINPSRPVQRILRLTGLLEMLSNGEAPADADQS